MTDYVRFGRYGGYDVILLTNRGGEGSEDTLAPIPIGVANKPSRESGAQGSAVIRAEVGLLDTNYLVSFREEFYVIYNILSSYVAGGRVCILRETITVL